jgi:hypothetical protein
MDYVNLLLAQVSDVEFDPSSNPVKVTLKGGEEWDLFKVGMNQEELNPLERGMYFLYSQIVLFQEYNGYTLIGVGDDLSPTISIFSPEGELLENTCMDMQCPDLEAFVEARTSTSPLG